MQNQSANASMARPWSHIPLLGVSQKTSNQKLPYLLLLHSCKSEKKSIKNTPVPLNLLSSISHPPLIFLFNSTPPMASHPILVKSLKKAFESSAPLFSTILESLLPDLVIYDFNQPWAAEIASSLDIPAVEFVTIGASMVAFGLHLMKKNSWEEFPFPEIYLRDYERRKMLQDPADKDRMLRAMDLSRLFLLKTCREIEGKFIDSITCDQKFVPVGPLVPDLNPDDNRREDEEIIAWLDRKEEGSVVYALFGSEYFLTMKERSAISHGLELSNVNFIWALRFPLGEEISIKEALP